MRRGPPARISGEAWLGRGGKAYDRDRSAAARFQRAAVVGTGAIDLAGPAVERGEYSRGPARRVSRSGASVARPVARESLVPQADGRVLVSSRVDVRGAQCRGAYPQDDLR